MREPMARLEHVISQAGDDVFDRKTKLALIGANIALKAVSQIMKFFCSHGLVQFQRSLRYGVLHFTGIIA